MEKKGTRLCTRVKQTCSGKLEKHIAAFPFKKHCSSTTYNSHSFSDCYRAYIFNSLKTQQILPGNVGLERDSGGGRGKPYISNSERFHLSRKATSHFCWRLGVEGDLGGNRGALYCQRTIAEPFLTLQVS